MVVNTEPMPIEVSASLITPPEIDIHMAYAVQQRLDSHNNATQHALNHKATFDKKVMRRGGIVTFKKGQLVQVY